MRWIDQLQLRLRSFFRRTRVERDLDDELHFHVEQQFRDHLAAGLPLQEARDRARQSTGRLTLIKEQCRDALGVRPIDEVRQDLQYAGRTLRKNPGFTAAAVVSLALGIGVATALFTVLYDVVLHPFPNVAADRLLTFALLEKLGQRPLNVTTQQLIDLQRSGILDDVTATDISLMTLTGDGPPEAVSIQYFSTNGLSSVYRLPPFLGRTFSEADGQPGKEPPRVVVLTHHYWLSHFGGRANVIGQTMVLNRQSYEIIGVLPPSAFRQGQGGGTDIVAPLHTPLDPRYVFGVFGRLKPDTTLQMAEAGLQPLFQRFAQETPHLYPQEFRVQLQTFIEARRSSNYVPTIILIFAAAVLLLALACVNVSILLLSRGTAREPEFAIRTALGASRGRVIRQLLMESLLLAVAGAGLGVAIGYVGVPAILRWVPPNAFPVLSQNVQASLPVLLFSAAVTVLSAVLFGLSPALAFSRTGATHGIHGRIRITTGRGSRRLQHLLLAGQVALTILLLAGTGAAVRALVGLYRVSLDYDPHNVLAAYVTLPENSYLTWESRADFYERLRSRLAELPDVKAATLSFSGLPPRTGGPTSIEIPGQDASQRRLAFVERVSSQYVSTLKIPLLDGRVWSEVESARAARLAVVNQTMARQLWPHDNPIGRRVRAPQFAQPRNQFVLPAPGLDGWFEIIGVVHDTPNTGLHEPPAPAMYVPHTTLLGTGVALILRTTRDPRMMTQTIRQAVQTIDPNQPVSQETTAEEVLDQAGWARERFVTLLLSAFAGFALILAAVGLYSVVSYSVARRVREFGIRTALGASGISIVGVALRSTSFAIASGVAMGLMLSLASGTIIGRWSIGNLSDPWVLGLISLVFVVIATVAASIPARRAASITPVVALRTE